MINNSWYNLRIHREAIAREVASIEKNGDTFHEDVTTYDTSKTVLFFTELPTIPHNLRKKKRTISTGLTHIFRRLTCKLHTLIWL